MVIIARFVLFLDLVMIVAFLVDWLRKRSRILSCKISKPRPFIIKIID